MKHLLLTGALGLTFVSCSTLSEPLTTSSENPLNAPFQKKDSTNFPTTNEGESTSSSPQFPPGTTVQVSASDIPFYSSLPRFFKRESAKLSVGQRAEVIGVKNQYTQVVLESGDNGFIESKFLLDATPTAAELKEDQSDSVPPPLPSSESLGDESLPSITSTASDEADQLSDAEILERIQKRKESLQQLTEPEAPSISLPEPGTEFVPDQPPKLPTPAAELE